MQRSGTTTGQLDADRLPVGARLASCSSKTIAFSPVGQCSSQTRQLRVVGPREAAALVEDRGADDELLLLLQRQAADRLRGADLAAERAVVLAVADLEVHDRREDPLPARLVERRVDRVAHADLHAGAAAQAAVEEVRLGARARAAAAAPAGTAARAGWIRVSGTSASPAAAEPTRRRRSTSSGASARAYAPREADRLLGADRRAAHAGGALGLRARGACRPRSGRPGRSPSRCRSRCSRRSTRRDERPAAGAQREQPAERAEVAAPEARLPALHRQQRREQAEREPGPAEVLLLVGQHVLLEQRRRPARRAAAAPAALK